MTYIFTAKDFEKQLARAVSLRRAGCFNKLESSIRQKIHTFSSDGKVPWPALMESWQRDLDRLLAARRKIEQELGNVIHPDTKQQP